MKLAVLSDIHGNVPALEAVLEDLAAWAPDRVVVNGDVINRGPCSVPVLELLQRHRPDAIRLAGNHETFTLAFADAATPREGPAFETKRFSLWTYLQLGVWEAEIARWPGHLDLELGGARIHITHGSRISNRDGIGPRTTDAELPALLGDRRELFIGSHTHWPLVRDFDGTLVINSGSVGAPFDRDPRASYVRCTFSRGRWRAQIQRVHYDRQRHEQNYLDTGFLQEGGPLARIMLTEHRLTRGLMGPWMQRYQRAVIAGELTLAESVERHLQEFDTTR